MSRAMPPSISSFDELAEWNRAHMQRQGTDPSRHTFELALMQMMSAVGELASLSHRDLTAVSPFEREEVMLVLGRLTASLVLVGESLEVPLGEAVGRWVESETPAEAPDRPVLLSPTSRESYFHYVDELRGLPREAFERANLKWVAPTPEGQLEELVAGGARMTVRHADLPEYLRRIQTYRDAGGPPAGGLPRGVDGRPAVRPPLSWASPAGESLATTAEAFAARVGRLQRGEVTGPAVAALGLTFCVPQGDYLVELQANGLQTRVTEANAEVFLRSLQNYYASPTSTGRVHRTSSIRRLEVPSRAAAEDQKNFSPSHFAHGLFAPFEGTSTFYVNYDEADSILPPSLKEPPGPPRDTSAYLGAARAGDVAALERMIEDVRRHPALLDRHGVTFAVPAALEPLCTPEERRSGLHALFPNSALQRVQPSQIGLFLALVRQYFTSAS